jgi:type VI secretion system secreted protein VgrG
VDCRIYTDASVPDIVQSVLKDAGYTDVKVDLGGDYAKREYCVQYREDCLNFISRLMQQEGIYYYFTHDKTKHTMVLADGVSGHAANEGFVRVPYLHTTDSVLRRESTITTWASSRGADAVKYQLTDYDPMAPKSALLSTGSSDGHGSAGTSPGMVAFDFPGAHKVADVGQHFAQVRAEALTAARSYYKGSTSACSAEIGALFTLSDYPREEHNREYLIIGTTIHLAGAGSVSGGGDAAPAFRCEFDAIESSKTFRSLPTAVKPTIVGLQTAIVCGSETDEDIVVDQHGRVQVTFHWNKPDKPNAKSSCPVRVAVGWQEMGRHQHSARGTGSSGEFSRRRPGSPADHRQRLQRRQPGALQPAGQQDAKRHQEPQLVGWHGGFQRTALRRQEGQRRFLHACAERHARGSRERSRGDHRSR